jgi:hypothetical protein
MASNEKRGKETCTRAHQGNISLTGENASRAARCHEALNIGIEWLGSIDWRYVTEVRGTRICRLPVPGLI